LIPIVSNSGVPFDTMPIGLAEKLAEGGNSRDSSARLVRIEFLWQSKDAIGYVARQEEKKQAGCELRQSD
jgi:hypothetical protein